MSSTYTTVQGDTWDIIAKKNLDNEYYMTDILQANMGYKNTITFSAGVVLSIPDVDTSSDIADGLPPWKGGS